MISLSDLFFPTKSNHYQAILAKPVALTILIGAILAINLGRWGFLIYDPVQGESSDLSAINIISFTNSYRQANHLPPLTENALLTQAAFNKANDMLLTGNFQHYYASGNEPITPWKFIDAVGYVYQYAGENLGRGFSSADKLVTAWTQSPPHQANLANPNYTEIGVAVVEGAFAQGKPTVLVVQILASPLPGNLIREQDSNTPNLYQATPFLIDRSLAIADFISLVYLPLTLILLFTLGFVVYIDFTSGQRLRRRHLPSHLWRH